MLSCWLSCQVVVGLLILASCTPAVTPPPNVTPRGEDRYLIDPRAGSPAADPQTEQKLDAAWRFALAGNEAEARRLLDEIRKKNPGYAPASLVQAAIDIRANRFDAARAIVQKYDTLAARVYEAEIAFRENDTRRALELYRTLEVPAAPERIAVLENTLYEQLFAAAQTAPDAQAIPLLREALTFKPAAIEPRIQLARRLVTQRSFDDARRELEPLL
ncbi:MAG TPA: tetratricopeptide repeat protein, partial [Thermoanaerobaculia bacterium]|nr:tetratricopeptide repeat protein [Thermoanaerobaculia bacterium]